MTAKNSSITKVALWGRTHNYAQITKAKEWQPPRVTRKRFHSGEVAPHSGVFIALGANGKTLKREVTLVEGDLFPPLPPGGKAYRGVKSVRWGVEVVRALERLRQRGTWGRDSKG